MATEDRNWFLRERSQALAYLLLTSRDDVAVRREEDRDEGVDFLVSLKEQGRETTKMFVVQARGALSSDESEWARNVKPLFKSGVHYLPVCVFMVNVRTNEVGYAWLAEPEVVESGAKLNFFEQPQFHRLDREVVNRLIDRVEAWYDAIPHSFISNAS